MKASRKRPSRLAQKFSRRAAAHFALPFQVNKGFPLERAPQSRTTPIYTEEAQSALASAPIALPSACGNRRHRLRLEQQKTELTTMCFTQGGSKFMGSVKSSVKGWHTVGTLLAFLFVILLQAQVGWPQEIVPPKLDEEFGKQDKIYRSRGADVPSGYVTNRGLSDYASLLPSGFCDMLGRLGNSDRWLDIGAGDGQAVLDYYASEPKG